MNNKTACIDIGSNSVRLLMPKAGRTVCGKPLISTRLAEGLINTGGLSEAAMNRTRDAVVSFYKTAIDGGYTSVRVFATAAVRRAANGAVFCELLRREGITVDVIDGDKEAELGFKGAVAGLDSFKARENGKNTAALYSPASDAIVFDIGGASTEIVRGNADGITYKKSVPIGMVVLRDIAGTDKRAIERTLDEYLSGFDGMPRPAPAPIYGIGGTATSLASMALRLDTYDAEKTHGCYISLNDLNRMEYDVFTRCTMQPDKILGLYNVIGASRALIIGQGIVTARRILSLLNADGFTVSETDSMEAYLLD